MFRGAVARLLISVLVAGFAANAGVPGRAGDKKDKTKDVKKDAPGPLLNQKSELNKDDEKDSKFKNSPCKVFKLKFDAGKVYRIEMKSAAMDVVLRLEDSAGTQVAEDDDSAGDLNARIYYKAGKSGEYQVIATCHNRGRGAFALSVAEAPGVTVASEFQGTPTELKWKDGKGHVSGLLEEKDALALGRYHRVFTVALEAAKAYRIDLQSDEFDALLYLEDPDGVRLARDDDGGDRANARLRFSPAKAATYRIIATSTPARQTGRFTLTIMPDSSKEKTP